MVIKKKISDFTSIIGNVAQSSHYQVFFGGLSSGLFGHLNGKGVNKRFITENAGLLCSSASIPGSSLATTDIIGNYMGVQEKMAHTRLFTELTLEFYVDKDYKLIKFLEHWMEYISNGSGEDVTNPGYYYRMRYPRDAESGYKADKTKIVKFDRDYRKEIEYTFYGLFPINFASTPVQYGNSDVLRASCVFNYERYIAGKETSISSMRGDSQNSNPLGLVKGLIGL